MDHAESNAAFVYSSKDAREGGGNCVNGRARTRVRIFHHQQIQLLPGGMVYLMQLVYLGIHFPHLNQTIGKGCFIRFSSDMSHSY